MASEKVGIDLWKVVVGLGAAIFAAGVQLMANGVEPYGLVLLAGGLLLVLLGITYAAWERHEWKRPPRLPRSLRCLSFPTTHAPSVRPGHPYGQHLALRVERPIPHPRLRVICSAPLRRIDVWMHDASGRGSWDVHRSEAAIDAVTLRFPLEGGIEPGTKIRIEIYSEEPIRVRSVQTPKANSKPTNSLADPPPTKSGS